MPGDPSWRFVNCYRMGYMVLGTVIKELYLFCISIELPGFLVRAFEIEKNRTELESKFFFPGNQGRCHQHHAIEIFLKKGCLGFYGRPFLAPLREGPQ